MDLGSVLVQCAGGLCAEIPVARIELERGDAVFAAHAGKLHPARDPLDGVVSHWLDCSPRLWDRRRNSKKGTHQS